MIIPKTLSILLLTLSISFLFGQDSTFMLVEIQIDGNKRTKESVILRELSFQIGDTISAQLLPTIAQRNEKLVMNTGLFTAVNIELEILEKGRTKAIIEVREFWYFFLGI